VGSLIEEAALMDAIKDERSELEERGWREEREEPDDPTAPEFLANDDAGDAEGPGAADPAPREAAPP
jgi:hypothetical protein